MSFGTAETSTKGDILFYILLVLLKLETVILYGWNEETRRKILVEDEYIKMDAWRNRGWTHEEIYQRKSIGGSVLEKIS